MRRFDLATPSPKLHAVAAVVLTVALVLVYGRVGGYGYSGFDDAVTWSTKIHFAHGPR